MFRSKGFKTAAVLVIVAAATRASFGQDTKVPINRPGGGDSIFGLPLDDRQFSTIALLFLFGVIIIGLQLLVVRKIQGLRSDDVLRNISVTLVIVSTLVLMISNLSSEVMAPAFGLFGTIIGYILGRTERRDTGQATEPSIGLVPEAPSNSTASGTTQPGG